MAHIIDSPVAVLVEGADYSHYLIHSYKEMAFWAEIRVSSFGGTSDLGKFLRTFRATHGFDKLRALGIIRDAETDGNGACEAIRASLRQNDLPVPRNANEFTNGLLKVGYLVIPHGAPSGCLEHACLDACANPRARNCASAFLDCVGRSHDNENWNAKVQTRAIIASSGSPGAALGQSALLGIWNRDAPSLKIIETFLRGLSAVTAPD